jgi:hypothetical protein
MNEPLKPTPPVNAPVAPPAVQPAFVGAPASQSVPLFGGHRGGGKKRADGLPAGSPEAIAADRKKDALRQAANRAKKNGAALPATLPAAVAAVQTPSAPVAVGASPVPGPVAGVAVAAAPLFVPWSQKLLEKPARLLTKIADRLRCWSLMKKVRKLGLTSEQEKEIASDLKWKDDVVADFNLALAECATVELNKYQVSGAAHSHWINLAMCGGEMALVHVQTLERLEKMVAANAAARQEAKTQDAAKN